MSRSGSTDLTLPPMGAMPEPGPQHLAGRLLLASGALAAVGVAFLIAMAVAFAIGAGSAGLAFGRINDVLVLVSYLLAAPSVVALRVLLRPQARRVGDIVALIGLTAIAAIVVLQFLLIVGALTFEQQVGPVSLALLVLGGWFVLAGSIGSTSGVLPRGARMGLLAATYIGYPIWAFWISRRLGSGNVGPTMIHPDGG